MTAWRVSFTPDMNYSMINHIRDALPSSAEGRIYHISTPPFQTSALFAAPPGRKEEPTLCQNHFIAIGSQAKSPLDITLVYALEIFIFSTSRKTTIFVSKADTSGYLRLLDIPPQLPSIIRSLTTSILQYFLAALSNHAPILITLFARSQNQYLFPGSIENPGKHLLDDRQLIKWWCRILDDVVRNSTSSGTLVPVGNTSEGYLVVPGCDSFEIRNFFPPTTTILRPGLPSMFWGNRLPVEVLAPYPDAPVRCLVPRFPDDPKQRFLDDLDFREVDDEGHWRSVRSLDEFWELMQYRQECSAGKLVGFLWAVINPQAHRALASNDTTGDRQDAAKIMVLPVPSPHQPPQPDIDLPSLPTPSHSQLLSSHPSELPPPLPELDFDFLPTTTPPPSSPILPPENDRVFSHVQVESLSPSRKPLDANAQSDTILESQPTNDTTHPDILQHFPSSMTSQSLSLTQTAYDTLLTYLLDTTDFSTQPLASAATKSWIARAAELANVSSSSSPSEGVSEDWGIRFTGRPQIPPSSSSASLTTNATNGTSTAPPAPVVNILTGVRKKKRKPSADLSVIAINDVTPNGLMDDAKRVKS